MTPPWEKFLLLNHGGGQDPHRVAAPIKKNDITGVGMKVAPPEAHIILHFQQSWRVDESRTIATKHGALKLRRIEILKISLLIVHGFSFVKNAILQRTKAKSPPPPPK
jgi:hypothetical protein